MTTPRERKPAADVVWSVAHGIHADARVISADEIERRIAEAVSFARAEERERCVKLLDERFESSEGSYRHAANAIRALGEADE